MVTYPKNERTYYLFYLFYFKEQLQSESWTES